MTTVSDEVNRLHALYGKNGSARKKWIAGVPENPRVIKHDGLHLVLDYSVLTFRGEIANAITHSILERNSNVYEKYHNPILQKSRHNRHPSLHTIKTKTLPEIMAYMDKDVIRVHQAAGLPHKLLNEQEVIDIYNAAIQFDKFFTERFSKPFCEFSGEEFGKMDFNELKDMALRARQEAVCHRLGTQEGRILNANERNYLFTTRPSYSSQL